jgi:plastocyanin
MQPSSKSIATAFFSRKSQIVPSVGTRSAGTGVARSSLHRHLSVLATWSLLLLGSLTNLRATAVQVLVGDGGLKFNPASVTIQVGDTVKWTWSAGTHSTTSGTPGAPDGIWDSGIQSTPFTFSHTFSDAGSFPYFCRPHGACCGMIGSVTVRAPTLTSVTAFVVKQTCLNGDFVQVTLSATVQPNQPAKYRWDFTNNGTFDTALSSVPKVTHNYPDERRITARVRMVNAQGMVRFDTVTFTTKRCTGGGG